MTNEKIRAALAIVVDRIKAMEPAQFRAEIEARQAGDLAQALCELATFASEYLPSGVVVSSAIIDAVHWGIALQNSFDPVDFRNWIAANDVNFTLAA